MQSDHLLDILAAQQTDISGDWKRYEMSRFRQPIHYNPDRLIPSPHGDQFLPGTKTKTEGDPEGCSGAPRGARRVPTLGCA